MKKLAKSLIAAALCAACLGAVHAQSYPNKPVKLIVPFAPGGFTDVVARILGQRLSTAMGLSAFGAITTFGVVVAGFMYLIQRWHKTNCIKHKEQVDHLLSIARSDASH